MARPLRAQRGLLLTLLLVSGAAHADRGSAKFKLDLSTEVRIFPESPADPRQSGSTGSFAALGRFDYLWNSGRTGVVVSPFGRWDSGDGERTHADLRDFELRHRDGRLDVRAGIGRVFWGATESVHLVDVINQTDAVESVDGEDKLGQPLLSLAWTGQFGTVTGFLLPYFRERTLPGVHGRVRASVPYDADAAVYESSLGRRHVDAAVRWSFSGEGLDAGLSHFAGTAREPRYLLRLEEPEPRLVSVYDLIHQSSLDLTVVRGSWLWKLEALHQRNRVRNFGAAVGGFEYTLPTDDPDAATLGLLAECAWDSRNRNSPSPFQRDLFVGTRVSLNDVASTEFLAGVMQDLQGSGAFVTVDASRRLGTAGRLTLKLRVFAALSSNDPLAALARDDHLVMEYTHHF